MDTIIALASAQGRAGVAVVRASGPRAWDLCRALCGDVPPARVARLRVLRDSAGTVLDKALVLLFDEGRSFTGERVFEAHVHGSRAVIQAVLAEALRIDGVRLAEAGEFTRRAFEAGKLSLIEVEGLADLLAAETEAQRRQAIRITSGAGRDMVERWREDLLQATALITAVLDFADEDLPQGVLDGAFDPLERVRSGIVEEISGYRAAERIRDGFEVAIVGEVNVGKSTLLNALARRDAAITSEHAGTTRDVIEVRIEIDGLAVTLIDTAGLRDAEDPVERMGIARGRDRAEAADLRIYLKSNPTDQIARQEPGDIVVLSKSDLWKEPGVSARTGEGMEALISSISDRLSRTAMRPGHFSHLRQFEHLKRAERLLETAVMGMRSGALEVAADDLRLAVRALDGIVGRLETEDVLGSVFSSFCIGK